MRPDHASDGAQCYAVLHIAPVRSCIGVPPGAYSGALQSTRHQIRKEPGPSAGACVPVSSSRPTKVKGLSFSTHRAGCVAYLASLHVSVTILTTCGNILCTCMNATTVLSMLQEMLLYQDAMIDFWSARQYEAPRTFHPLSARLKCFYSCAGSLSLKGWAASATQRCSMAHLAS